MAVAGHGQASKLSTRAQAVATPNTENPIWDILKDQWHPETNPHGYVSIGVAENRLMHTEVAEHIKANMNVPLYAFTYGDGPLGSNILRSAVASFLNRHLHPVLPLESSHIVITNGVTHAIEHCSWAFANPGDGFLLGQPHYTAFIPDISLRPGVEVVTVRFGGLDPMSVQAVEKYEQALLDAKSRGVTVRALMLCSPHNPLGRCYPREAIVEYMKLCQKYHIHLVSDEIYALSTWKNNEDSSPPPVDFVSALSIPLDDVIDPGLVHVLWGMSKDFGANGIRVGCLISQHENTAFFQALQAVGLYSSASSIADHVAANILLDDVWTDAYIEKNQRLLSQSYSFAVDFLKKHDLSYTPGANAAFFLWVDLGQKYLERHPERKPAKNEDITVEISKALLKHRVHLGSGRAFGAETPGLFRIVFSHPREYLEEALRRMLDAIEE